jgi:hypothetical protein
MPSASADKEGRFRIEGLVPGASYALNLRQGAAVSQSLKTQVTAESGQTKDLGDLVVRTRALP